MIRQRAYDVSELGMTYFLRTFADGPSPFLAIPVFPVRAFRHGAIYVNKASGIERPQDLVGKRIGELALYGHDVSVMPKGIVSDEFGVRPERCRWIVGGIDFPMDPIDFVAKPVPDGVGVDYAGKDIDLGDLLEAGEIDALISADVPKCVLEKSSRVGRLFEDYEAVEALPSAAAMPQLIHCFLAHQCAFALTLAVDETKLPDMFGVLTTRLVLGQALIARLGAFGMSIDVDSFNIDSGGL